MKTLLSTDQSFWSFCGVMINATIINTWFVMLLLIVLSYILKTFLKKEIRPSKWQLAVEIVIEFIQSQISDLTQQKSVDYIPFIGTLFLFISLSNIFDVLPFLQAPTGSLSTTTALAICVFLAVPIYSISKIGVVAYLKNYFKPSIFIFPFAVISELSRTVALAIRLYGNVMSGTVIVGILLSITPFIFPVLMNILGLLTGVIQAYIFSVLALVYIASASKL